MEVGEAIQWPVEEKRSTYFFYWVFFSDLFLFRSISLGSFSIRERYIYENDEKETEQELTANSRHYALLQHWADRLLGHEAVSFSPKYPLLYLSLFIRALPKQKKCTRTPQRAQTQRCERGTVAVYLSFPTNTESECVTWLSRLEDESL